MFFVILLSIKKEPGFKTQGIFVCFLILIASMSFGDKIVEFYCWLFAQILLCFDTASFPFNNRFVLIF